MEMKLIHTRALVLGKNADTPLVINGEKSIGRFYESQSRRIWTANELLPTDYLVCVDTPRNRDEWKILKNTALDSKKILIRFEPKVVLPGSFSSKFENIFTQVIEVGRPKALDNNVINWPQSWNAEGAKNVGIRKHKSLILNANKLSFIRGELYSLRRLCAHKITGVEVKGHNWELTKLRKIRIFLVEFFIALRYFNLPVLKSAHGWFRNISNYLGSVDDKLVALSAYHSTIVIENSLEFMTEKLFDALFARTIPIYVGPKVSEFSIPNDLVVQAQPNIAGIRAGIEILKKIDYSAWCLRVDEWLNREDVKSAWEAERVFAKILEICDETNSK